MSVITLTPTKAIRLKSPEGLKVYKPGQTFKADLEEAQPFINKGLLRKVEVSTLRLTVGQVVEWDSPIFGRLTGRVQKIQVDYIVQVHHPLTGDNAAIPIEWIKRIIEGPDGT